MSDDPTEVTAEDQQPKEPPRPPPDKSWVKTQKETYSQEPGSGRPPRRPGTSRDR
jgi:hypothetical protein